MEKLNMPVQFIGEKFKIYSFEIMIVSPSRFGIKSLTPNKMPTKREVSCITNYLFEEFHQNENNTQDFDEELVT